MKKLLFLLSVVLFSGCGCIMSQTIPPQYLQIDESCGAALPDYLPMFRFTDNCRVDTVWQSPTRGTWLTVPTTTVLIRAIDNFNNHTDVMFTVTLTDTIGPVITLGDSSLIADNYSKINSMYDAADRMLLLQSMWFNSAVVDSIAVFITDDEVNDVLVTYTTPGLAFTGIGGRWHVFAEPGDTLIMPIR